jgi:L-alanine-DL-glutamate epimerase-like enolase superfamily enzyme
MRITDLESLHVDAGGRNFDFLKISTDEGLVGWSEYNESFGGPGVSALIAHLAPLVVGKDPCAYESVVNFLGAARRPAGGGPMRQAIGAVENALLDIKAKALGIPVYELFGGPLRERIHLYWSHCGLYRVLWHEQMQIPPLRNLGDVVELGREVAASGFTALKTNVLMFDGDEARVYVPGFGSPEGYPDRNPDRSVIRALEELLAVLREGCGPDVEILVDLNFNFTTEGFLRVARAVESFDLFWLEIDTPDPAALRTVREGTTIPIASCECCYGRRAFRPFLEHGSLDVAMVDVPMNGLAESLKIASLADTYEVNVAPHNFYSPLSTMMSAHFCAAIPNLRTMEIDLDTVPWYEELVTELPKIEDGHLLLPSGPGWGTEVNEEAARSHPSVGRPSATPAVAPR